MGDSKQYVPRHLGDAGRALWRSIVSELAADAAFDGREIHELTQACEIEDQLEALRLVIDQEGVTTAGSRKQSVIHPALAESRQLRLVQFRLLRALSFEPPEDDAKQTHPRWSRQARVAAMRQGGE